MKNDQKQQQKKRRNRLKKWHQRMGVVAALFLLNLSVTGLLLNHYEWFNFHKKNIQANWLLDWYGVLAPGVARCYTRRPVTACELDGLLYLNRQYWQKITAPLIGMVDTAEGTIIATADSLFFLSRQMELIEQLSLIDTIDNKASQISIEDDRLINLNSA